MSYLQRLSGAELARHYRMFKETLAELERRDDLRSCQEDTISDKQILFSFAKEQNIGDNLSVESYEAGYSAGWKASRKDLKALQKIAEEVGETLICRHGRPVITKAMRQHMPCPFDRSEPDL